MRYGGILFLCLSAVCLAVVRAAIVCASSHRPRLRSSSLPSTLPSPALSTCSYRAAMDYEAWTKAASSYNKLRDD